MPGKFSVCPEAIDVQIQRDDGLVQIRRESTARSFEVTLLPKQSNLYIPRRSCQTTLSLEIIEFLLDRIGFAWLCDTLARHESGVSITLERQLFAYFAPTEFAGKRLMDFGCGRAASTIALARMLPESEVVGVELSAERIETANRLKSFRQVSNAHFVLSPAEDRLPAEIGMFDFVILSAVYEHLLPRERKTLMPLLWACMKPGAAIFINQTPYRYFPVDQHSTGLWLINYLPDKAAHFAARHFSRLNPSFNRSKDWNEHLRGGVRGATEREIMRNLTSGDAGAARILQPQNAGIRDRADFWLSQTGKRQRAVKKLIAGTFRITDRFWGTIPAANVNVVIQKQY